MSSDEAAVRAANKEFYDALEALDEARMAALWLHEGWVQCIHPGSDVLKGWTAIHPSWAQIFAGTEWLRVIPTNVDVHVNGALALVICAENITSKYEGEVRVAVVLATNLFQKTDGGWRMVHHHASAAPVQVTQAFNGTVQ